MCCVQLVRQAAHASARERVVDKLDHLAECIGNYRLAVVRPDSYMAVIGKRQAQSAGRACFGASCRRSVGMCCMSPAPNFKDAGDFYERLLEAHEGFSREQSEAFNARLILVMAHAVGSFALLARCLTDAG